MEGIDINFYARASNNLIHFWSIRASIVSRMSSMSVTYPSAAYSSGDSINYANKSPLYV